MKWGLSEEQTTKAIILNVGDLATVVEQEDSLGCFGQIERVGTK